MKIVVKNLSDLSRLAKNIAKTLKGNETLALIGDLGTGKTTFTKALLKEAGIKKRIPSPTFVLMIPYQKGTQTFYHMDLYRLKGFKEVEALGVKELWNKKDNVFVIEWAEKIKRHLPENTIYLYFKVKNEDREIEIKNAPKHLKI